MDERQTGWERAVGPVGGALLAGAALIVFGGVASAIGLSNRLGFFGYTPLTSNPVTGSSIPFPRPPFRERLELVVQQVNFGAALLVLAAVALAAFALLAAPRVPAAARNVARVGAGLSWVLVALAVYGVYDAFNPPGTSSFPSTWQKLATAAPRAAMLAVSGAAAWLATRALSPAPPTARAVGNDPAPFDLEP